MLTRRQYLFHALLMFAGLCLPPSRLTAKTHHAAALTVVHTRGASSGKKALKSAPVASSRYSHAGRRKEIRAEGSRHKLDRAVVRAAKRRERVRGPQPEPPKTLLTAARSPSLVMKPNVADGAEEGTESIRETYLAHEQAASPSVQVPVVSLVRPTMDRPQLLSPQEVAATPEILPSLYDKRGRLVMPAPLRGSHEILLHQNEVADRDGLARVRDDDDLDEMRRRAMLVALPVNAAMQVDERLPANRRYCRPWTANFLMGLARAHYAHFHTALQVNSAVRTVTIQRQLLRTNGNAAPAAGESASPHLTGQAIDIGKRGLSLPEIAWMRGYLLPLAQDGKIDVEEEFQQSCFHISVYKKYMPGGAAPENIAVTHRDRPAALAIMLH